MIKSIQFNVAILDDKKNYFTRMNTNLSYEKFKRNNWNNQLKFSFQKDDSYKTKKKFFKKFYTNEYKTFVEFIVKNVNKKKTILSIGSGRGIGELKLIDKGYNITLSDINYPSGLKDLKKNFKKFNYIKYDLFRHPIKKKYDYVICCNLIYAFDKKKLSLFFKRSKLLLKKNGSLILSPGGSLLNFYKIIYDLIYLPLENFLAYIYLRLKNKRCAIKNFHHGYVYSYNEILQIAKKNNFYLEKKIFKDDNLTELNRSKIIPYLISKSIIFKRIFLFFGNKVKFLNFFSFRKI